MINKKNKFSLFVFIQRRIEEVEQSYYYATLGDKESNPFSLGIAVRFPYGEFDIRTTDPETEKIQIGLKNQNFYI